MGICSSILTQKGRLLKSAVVLANHKANIDYLNSPTRKLSKLRKNAEKFCSDGEFDVVVDIYSKLLCLWITSPVMRAFSDRFRCIHPQPLIAIFLISDAQPKFVFSYPFPRYFLHAWTLLGTIQRMDSQLRKSLSVRR